MAKTREQFEAELRQHLTNGEDDTAAEAVIPLFMADLDALLEDARETSRRETMRDVLAVCAREPLSLARDVYVSLSNILVAKMGRWEAIAYLEEHMIEFGKHVRRVRHRALRSESLMVAVGTLQTDYAVEDGTELVIHRDDSGAFSVTPTAEFQDGRFEKID